MFASLHNDVRTYHPTMPGAVAAVILIPVLILVTWPAAAMLGDARTMLIEFVGVPLFCFLILMPTLHGNSFQFSADEYSVQIQRRVLLIAVGAPLQVPFRTITDLDWQEESGGGDLTMIVSGQHHYYVTISRAKSRLIAQMVVQDQPNLRANLQPELI